MTGTPLDTLLASLNGPNLHRVERRTKYTDILFNDYYTFQTQKGEKVQAICLTIHRHETGEYTAYLPYVRPDNRAVERLTIMRRAWVGGDSLEKLKQHLRAMGVL